MPHGVSGGALARVLRARDPRLRVVYTSGYSSEIARQDLHLAQGANFLRKPYNPSALLTAVRQSLDNNEQAPNQGRVAEPDIAAPCSNPDSDANASHA